MIESDCAGCTETIDALSSGLNYQQKQNYPSPPPAVASKQANSINHLSSSLRDSLASFSQPSTSSPATTPIGNLQSGLSHFQHYNLQPLIGPNFLLAPSAVGSGQLPLGPSGQFALTPDARACVTATYLCVLIVNNTWLDCNLLETLCNSSQQQNNGQAREGNSSLRADRKQEEYQLAAAAEAAMKLNALESALSELIAFAGGGSSPSPSPTTEDTSYSESASQRSAVYIQLPQYLRSEAMSTLGSQRHLEPYVDKGGGGEDEGEGDLDAESDDDASVSDAKPPLGQTMSRLRSSRPPEDEEQDEELADKGRGAHQGESEKPKTGVELYLDALRQPQQISPKQQDQARQQQLDTNFELARGQVQNSSSGSPLSGGSSLSSWVGRPFRAWSSYSFWSSGGGGGGSVGAQPSRPDEPQLVQLVDPNQSHQQLVQILRPVADKSDQYNDIVTNQSSLKQQSVVSGQPQQIPAPTQHFVVHNQQPVDHAASQPENSGSSGIHTTEPVSILAVNNNNNQNNAAFIHNAGSNSNGPTTSSSSTNTIDNNNSNNQPIFAFSPPPSLSAQGSSFVGGEQLVGQRENEPFTGGGSSNGMQPQLRYPTTPSAALMGLYEAANPSTLSSFASGLMTAGSPMHLQQAAADRSIQRQQHLLMQQQQPFLQDNMGEPQQQPCKCNEFESQQMSQMSPSDECRYRCSSASAASAVATTPSRLNDVTQLATAPTFATPSTTLSPNAKMNPLDVTFLLYTRNSRLAASDRSLDAAGSDSALNESSLLNPETVSTTNAGLKLNGSLPIKIVIHGFGSGGRRPWVTDMVYKLLDYEDANVIVVDWEKGATLPNYVQAAGNTRLVGHKIATLIKSINAKFGLTGNSYHLIGFSLGAHVAGFAGMEIRNSTNVARLWINRITGLDPASPLFEGYEANDRLDPSDAQFVDVIHSNGDGVLRGGFGSLQPMGHVDFYPNGGRVQVGCNSVLLSALSDIIYGKWQSLCNHRRALNFFMDSFEFNKCRFRSFNCDSYENYLKGECFDCGHNNEKCSYMGYLANYSKGRGKMYLTTHEEAPFCANQFIIKILGTKGYKTHWGKVEVTLVTLDGKNESFWLSSMNQQSAGYELGGGQRETSQQQHSMQSLIVAHPVLVNFTQVLLRYTKYKGWIYSGDESWSIDKVFITDSDGQVKSYCGSNTILESHITSRLNLEPGNCTVVEPTTSGSAVRAQGASGNGGATNNLIASVSLSSSSAQQQQQQQQQPSQQQSQQQPSQSQMSQQQQTPSSQSLRTPRLFATMIQHSAQNEAQTTPVAMPLGHSFQRVPTERPPLFTMSYNNIPFVQSF